MEVTSEFARPKLKISIKIKNGGRTGWDFDRVWRIPSPLTFQTGRRPRFQPDGRSKLTGHTKGIPVWPIKAGADWPAVSGRSFPKIRPEAKTTPVIILGRASVHDMNVGLPSETSPELDLLRAVYGGRAASHSRYYWVSHLWQAKIGRRQGPWNDRKSVFELDNEDQVTKETYNDRWQRRQDSIQCRPNQLP